MCVIFFADKVRPSELMVEAAFQANSDGGGIAWREDGQVKWRKGLNLDEMLDLTQKLPIPFVAHFRIASIGGVSPQLTHPFPIEKDTSNALQGRTKSFVLFHNGHWGKWREDMREVSIKGAYPLPTGKWNDSRAMAWLAAHLGLGVLELIDEKVIAFGPKTSVIFGGVWSVVNDVLVSNRSWEGKFQTLRSRLNPSHRQEQSAENDRRALPAVYQREQVIEGPVVRQHNADCVCDDCIKLRLKPLPPPAKSKGGIPTGFDPFLHCWNQWKVADALWNQEPPAISKTKWKKARRAFQVQSWKKQERDRKAMSQQLARAEQVTELPVIH